LLGTFGDGWLKEGEDTTATSLIVRSAIGTAFEVVTGIPEGRFSEGVTHVMKGSHNAIPVRTGKLGNIDGNENILMDLLVPLHDVVRGHDGGRWIGRIECEEEVEKEEMKRKIK
jgi:hypothetical protein